VQRPLLPPPPPLDPGTVDEGVPDNGLREIVHDRQLDCPPNVHFLCRVLMETHGGECYVPTVFGGALSTCSVDEWIPSTYALQLVCRQHKLDQAHQSGL
jgi:hypothetical protein